MKHASFKSSRPRHHLDGIVKPLPSIGGEVSRSVWLALSFHH
jgi:hypothetical protein